MKRKLWIGLTVAVLGACASQSRADNGSTQVWQVSLTMNALQGQETNDAQVVSKKTATPAVLINFARDRDSSATVPGNEVLALAMDCHANSGVLLVWDTIGQSNLATIATIHADGVSPKKAGATKGKATFTMVGTIQDTGGVNFRLTGGWFGIEGSAAVDFTTDCQPSSFAGTTIVGELDGFDGDNWDVIVVKGKLTTLTLIGQFLFP